MERMDRNLDEITREILAVEFPQKCMCCPYMFQFECRAEKCPYDEKRSEMNNLGRRIANVQKGAS